MRAFASPTFRLAAGLAGPVLALAMAAPAQSADVIYERHSEYERYGEPPPPVYAPPVYAAPAYVPRRYAAPPVYAPYPPPVYAPYPHPYRGERVYRRWGAAPYESYGYVEVVPRPPAPIYSAPRRIWAAPPRELAEEEVVEAGPPYGWPAERGPRW